MTWKLKVPTKNTEPETQLDSILMEMKAEGTIRGFDFNTDFHPPFRIVPIEADRVVDGVLVIEVMGSRWHVGYRKNGRWHDAKTRHAKDVAKKNCFEAMGYGVLWLYDDELNKASIRKYRDVWRPTLKEWITRSLLNARLLHNDWMAYQACVRSRGEVTGNHPMLGVVSLVVDERRL